MKISIKILFFILLSALSRAWCMETGFFSDIEQIERLYNQITAGKTVIKPYLELLPKLHNKLQQPISKEETIQLKKNVAFSRACIKDYVSDIQQQCQKILELEQQYAENMHPDPSDPLSEPFEQELQSEQTIEQYYRDKKFFLEQVAPVIASTLEDEPLQALIKLYERQILTLNTMQYDPESDSQNGSTASSSDCMHIDNSEPSQPLHRRRSDDSGNSGHSEQELCVVDDRKPLLAQETTSEAVERYGYFGIFSSFIHATNQKKRHVD